MQSIEVHEQVVDAFARGWLDPTPDAWDELLDADVVLNQPFLRCGRGAQLWRDEVARLLAFLPDVRGEVLSWAGRDDVVFIHMRVSGTAGGRELTFTATDRLELDLSRGVVVRRDSYLDPTPVAATLLTRPGAWLPWWRSGVGPVLGRRKFLTPRSEGEAMTSDYSRQMTRALGVTRMVVGLTTVARPSLAATVLSSGGDRSGDGVDTAVGRMFGIRDAALAAATLSADPAVRGTGLRLGVVADVIDAGAVLLSRRGGVTGRGKVLLGGAAALFALAGFSALPRR